MLKLIEEAEVELHKIIPKKSHQEIKDDLANKQHLRDEVKKATEDILVKMKELSETLASVASAEQQQSLSNEVRGWNIQRLWWASLSNISATMTCAIRRLQSLIKSFWVYSNNDALSCGTIVDVPEW